MSKLALRSLAFISAFTFLISCENEYTDVGTGIIDSIEIQPAFETENIIAYSKKYSSIQTNGFRNLLLGSYADPVFGISEAKILTQVSLSQTRPNFGTNPIIDSVVMTLPFYSTQLQQNEYALDSVYGEGSFKLNVYRSNQLLRTLNPGSGGEFQDNQLYFTDQGDEFAPNINSEPLVISEVIKPSSMTKPTVLFETQSNGDVDTLSLSPRIRIQMPTELFQQALFNPANPEILSSNTAFRNFLRGFLLEAEQQQPVLSMAMFDMQSQDANIRVYYKNETEDTDEEGETTTNTVYSQFALDFSGVKLNLYDNNFTVDLSNQNEEEGEENIYLKGGEGSSGVIELFSGPDMDGNGVSDELDELREKNWLINEANLDLYLNDDIASTSKNRINRVFLFDIDEEVVLSDFINDPTGGSGNANTTRQVHLEPLSKDENGEPFYRIRLTSHINDILNNNADNVRLGLYVVTDVDQPDLVPTRNPQLEISERVPRSMLETPRGIVIHGNRSQNQAKRLRLRIIYTETN